MVKDSTYLECDFLVSLFTRSGIVPILAAAYVPFLQSYFLKKAVRKEKLVSPDICILKVI